MTNHDEVREEEIPTNVVVHAAKFAEYCFEKGWDNVAINTPAGAVVFNHDYLTAKREGIKLAIERVKESIRAFRETKEHRYHCSGYSEGQYCCFDEEDYEGSIFPKLDKVLTELLEESNVHI